MYDARLAMPLGKRAGSGSGTPLASVWKFQLKVAFHPASTLM
jgi:hypothetical protein